MKAKRRIPLLKKLLKQFGIEEERVRLDWVSASEGDRFAALVNEMTEQVRKLGPLHNDDKDAAHKPGESLFDEVSEYATAEA
jgi:F420-non-reducing hydrogenase iron-sulfur subunit